MAQAGSRPLSGADLGKACGLCWGQGRGRQSGRGARSTPVSPEMGRALASGSSCVPRRQEELVQQVRKRLEEALMADMLAHVEELARDGEAPLDRVGADEDEDDEDQEEGPDQDQEMEHV